MKTILIILISLSIAFASRLYVIKKPSYLTFDLQKESLKLSELSDLILSTNGFSTYDIEWSGLKTNSLFKIPKVTLVLTTGNQNSIKNNFDDKFVEIIDDDESLNIDAISQAYSKQFGTKSNDMVKIIDDYSREELNTLKEICTSESSIVYVINMDKIEEKNLILGIDSIVNKFYEQCNSGDNALVYLLSILPEQKDLLERTKRELGSNNTTKPLNEAIFYNDNYAVTFNILFWSSLFIGLAVIGISCKLWYMDPGSDTVIYRMTSQRIKKDQ